MPSQELSCPRLHAASNDDVTSQGASEHEVREGEVLLVMYDPRMYVHIEGPLTRPDRSYFTGHCMPQPSYQPRWLFFRSLAFTWLAWAAI